MTRGIHRAAAGTKAARQIMATTGMSGVTSCFRYPPEDPVERERYKCNARVEAEKLRKKEQKK